MIARQALRRNVGFLGMRMIRSKNGIIMASTSVRTCNELESAKMQIIFGVYFAFCCVRESNNKISCA